LAQPHSSFFFCPSLFVLIRIRESLDRVTSSFLLITLEVATQATGEKMPGEPFALALQENPLWNHPPGISSASRIVTLPATPSVRIQFLNALVIEKAVKTAFYRIALSRSSAQIRPAQSS